MDLLQLYIEGDGVGMFSGFAPCDLQKLLDTDPGVKGVHESTIYLG